MWAARTGYPVSAALLRRSHELLQRHHGHGERKDGVEMPPKPQLSRTPHWKCRCGEAENWATRASCRKCGDAAPQRVLKALEAAKRVPSTGAPSAPKGRWQDGPPGSDDAVVQKLRGELEQLKRDLAAKNNEKCGEADDSGEPEEMSLQKLEEFVAMGKAIGIPNPEAERQLQERQKKVPKPRTLESVRAQLRRAKHDFNQASEHLVKVEKQMAEARERAQEKAAALALAEQAELEELQRETAEKVPPKPAQPPRVSVEDLLANAVRVDVGSIFDLTGTDFEFEPADLEAIEKRKAEFDAELARLTQQAFGEMVERVQTIKSEERAQRERLRAKRQRRTADDGEAAGGAGAAGGADAEAQAGAAPVAADAGMGTAQVATDSAAAGGARAAAPAAAAGVADASAGGGPGSADGAAAGSTTADALLATARANLLAASAPGAVGARGGASGSTAAAPAGGSAPGGAP